MTEKKDETNVWLPLALSCMMAAGMVFGYKMNAKDESPLITHIGNFDDYASPVGQIEELIRFVETRYVDSIDREDLISEAIGAVLQRLDPHSIYITPDQIARVNEEMDGSFKGIGIESFYIDDTVNIITTIPEGPAERAGIVAFDKILQVGDTPVAGQKLPFEEIEGLIQNQAGDNVRLKLQSRDGGMRDVQVSVGDIPLKSVDIAFNITDDIGYIKINRFSSTTYKEFMNYFEEMYESQTKNMIIDLRGNPGGYLPQATNILSQLFRQKGNLLVYTEGKNDTKLEYKTTGKPFFNIDKISVLIDEGSASGSEIIAGALQEWDRALIVGRRSFGKGLVQEQYALGNGGAIRLTVARYYTPSGRSIQKTYDDLNDYDNDIYDRINSGELFFDDSTFAGNDKIYETMNLKRKVIGGGGITPDIFVPLDSIELDYDYLKLSEDLGRFVFKYVREPDFKVDLSDKSINDILNSYVKGAEDDIVSFTIKQQLGMDIRELLLRYSKGDLEAFKYLLSDDPYIQASLKYFSGEYQL